MEERIKELENEIDKLRYEIDFLKKHNEINNEKIFETIQIFTGFMNDNKELSIKFIDSFKTLENENEKTFKQVNELTKIVNSLI